MTYFGILNNNHTVFYRKQKKELLISNYPYNKCVIISDIFDEKHYIKESFYDKKFNLELYYGRPVTNTIGRNKLIITSELENFIFSTLDLPVKEFTNVIKKSAIVNLRRVLRNNPFSSYIRWKHRPQENKPKFITFNNSKENPEIIKDYFGNRFVILSARHTSHGLILAMGVSENSYLDKSYRSTKKYILTKDLAYLLKENRFYPHKILHLVPFNAKTLASLRSELGYNTYADRNAWLADHIEEILSSTAKGFCSKHSDMKIKKNVIATLKTHAQHIFSAVENNPALIEMLLKNWKNPSDASRERLDNLLTAPNSKKMRRTFSILKEAKLI